MRVRRVGEFPRRAGRARRAKAIILERRLSEGGEGCNQRLQTKAANVAKQKTGTKAWHQGTKRAISSEKVMKKLLRST